MPKPQTAILLLTLLLLPALAWAWPGKVIRIADADTIKVLTEDNQQDTDRYGRTVAIVILPDGTNLNGEIVRAGDGWMFTWYCREVPLCVGWGLLQQEAREPDVACGRTRGRCRHGKMA